MSFKFRATHLFHLLKTLETQTLPLDVFLRIYFKQNKSIGSHDRKYLAETIYGLTRWLGLVDYLSEGDFSWENRVSIFEALSPETHLENDSIPLHHRVSFPESYFNVLCQSLGNEKAKEFCLESNFQAPTTIRVNEQKISREKLLENWKGLFELKPGSFAPTSIHFTHRVNFFGLPEFKEGFFEVQDEASQLVALQVKALPGDHVLDYCCGSGGKTLAIAPLMKGKGQLYLHDIRSQVLVEAKKRLKRAGVQNAQLIEPGSAQKKRLFNKMDWVLVDAPCSGSGTLRRNPDMKWKFQEENLLHLLETQRAIFAEALSFVKPKGHIVYATCSVLPQENDLQTEFFLKNFPVKLVADPFHSFPKRGEMDGFYAVTLQKCDP